MQRTPCFVLLAALLSCNWLAAQEIDTIINSTVTCGAGEHTVASNVWITTAGTLQLQPGCTVIFNNAVGTIHNAGTLLADGTLFRGAGVATWGQLWLQAGSTARLAFCVLERGGGNLLPPPMTSNAVVYGECARVVVSNSVVHEPRGDCFTFHGGMIDFVQNVATSTAPGYGYYGAVRIYGGAPQPTVWRSSGNSLPGWPFPGIWVEGTFAHDLNLAPGPNERLHLAAVVVTNARMTVAAGATVALNDYVPGSVTVGAGAALLCQGTPTAPILWTNYFGINLWPGITWLPGSTGVLTSTTLTRASSHAVSNADVTLSDVRFVHLQDGLALTDHARLAGDNVIFHGMVNRGVTVRSHSILFLRQCQFIDNNAPYITSLDLDATGSADVRFCWWDAPDGPYPFGAYGNEVVSTNGTSVYFPWLLAAPGSQTNPPFVKITSHAEPFSTPAAQAVIQGIATDATQIARVLLRNGRSPITLQPTWLDPITWQAQIWLYAGDNPIAVYAYDDEGNASVDAVLINCTGAGVGDGGTNAPAFMPLGVRYGLVGVPLAFAVLAASPVEPAIMTYWAGNLPAGASFDPVQRQFAWTPPADGSYSNITFFVTDGGSVATTLCTIVVTTLPIPGILAISTPDMYAFQPYFYMAAPDGPTAPLDWRFSAMALPEGVALSRAGIICGVPLDLNQNLILPFSVRALNAAGVASATVAGNINRYVNDTGAKLRVLSYDLPAVLAGTPLLYQFYGTNGLPPLTWLDVNGDCAALDTALEPTGILTGAVAIAGMHPATILMRDATNRTFAAQVVLPIVATDQQLRYVPKKNSLNIMIGQSPTKIRKSTITLKAMFEAPAGFTLTSNDLAACRVGFVLCDAGLPFKTKFNKKNLFIQNVATRYTKIQVNRMANGMLKFNCTIKNANLRLHLAPYGIVNEEIPVLNATVPVWIQIGTHMTILQQVPVAGKAKFNVFSKAKAKW